MSFNIKELSVHIAIWVMAVLFISQFSDIRSFRFWYPLIQFALIFYLNYFLLFDRFLLRKKYLLFVIINVLIVALFRYDWLVHNLFDSNAYILKQEGHKQDISGGINHDWMDGLNGLFALFFPAIIANGIRIVQYRAKTENENLRTKLSNLKYQLHPHFFFNSLNNIYSLIEISPPKAQELVHKLGKLMRYVLYETDTEKAKLSDEIEFLERYIQLMTIRQSNKVKVEYDIRKPPDRELTIAPLLFMPLVENAFKHGVSATKPSHIVFKISYENEWTIFSSSNGNYPKNDTDKSDSGIGLKNLKSRLELTYPTAYSFNYGVENDSFIVDLRIRLK
jgi:two-component sensor histidine kinase